jgi:catechol 2,3-dioxygenase-like lactoylglutathione lyase family enzyme
VEAARAAFQQALEMFTQIDDASGAFSAGEELVDLEKKRAGGLISVSTVSPVLLVRDLDRSIEFYRMLGLRAHICTPAFARMQAGKDQVLLLTKLAEAPRGEPVFGVSGGGGGTAAVILQVNDCRQIWEQLVGLGVPSLKEPERSPHSQGSQAFVSDPDGNLIMLLD